MYHEVTPEPDYRSADLVAVWAVGARWKDLVAVWAVGARWKDLVAVWAVGARWKDLVAVWAGGARWKEDVKILGHLHCHFSFAFSPPREEDDMSQLWQLPHICNGGKVNGPQVFLPKSIWVFFM